MDAGSAHRQPRGGSGQLWRAAAEAVGCRLSRRCPLLPLLLSLAVASLPVLLLLPLLLLLLLLRRRLLHKESVVQYGAYRQAGPHAAQLQDGFQHHADGLRYRAWGGANGWGRRRHV